MQATTKPNSTMRTTTARSSDGAYLLRFTPADDLARYKNIAKERNVTLATLIREALEHYTQSHVLHSQLREQLLHGITSAYWRERTSEGGTTFDPDSLGLVHVTTDRTKAALNPDEADPLLNISYCSLYLPAGMKELQYNDKEGKYRAVSHYSHLVRQYEWQSRAQAIAAYVDQLANVLAVGYHPEDWREIVDWLLSPQHHYRIGLVDLRKWRSFDSEHELSARWLATWTNLSDVLPRDEEESRFYGWAKSWLSERWANRPAPNERGVIVLHPRQEGGVSWGNFDGESFMPFYPEPFKTETENIEAWARAMMRTFHGYGNGELLRFERYHEHVVAGGFYVVPLVVRQ